MSNQSEGKLSITKAMQAPDGRKIGAGISDDGTVLGFVLTEPDGTQKEQFFTVGLFAAMAKMAIELTRDLP